MSLSNGRSIALTDFVNLADIVRFHLSFVDGDRYGLGFQLGKAVTGPVDSRQPIARSFQHLLNVGKPLFFDHSNSIPAAIPQSSRAIGPRPSCIPKARQINRERVVPGPIIGVAVKRERYGSLPEQRLPDLRESIARERRDSHQGGGVSDAAEGWRCGAVSTKMATRKLQGAAATSFSPRHDFFPKGETDATQKR